MSPKSGGVALITGAAKRIGKALALDLAAAGYDIAVHYHRSADEAEETAAEIRNLGRHAHCFAADLARAEECQALIPRIGEVMGGLDLLINNASVFERDVVDDLTVASWDRSLDVNLRAPMLLIQAFAQQVPASGDGDVINIIDQKVWNLTPFYLSYTVAKAGLWTLTQTMAQALAPNIRVNAIGPGPVIANEGQSEADFQHRWQAMPLGRGAAPGELAAAVRFLLSARSMTGQMLALDGGQHLIWGQPKGDTE